MPTQRRHGLTTVLLTGDPDVRGALTDHLLAGRKTVVLRPVTEPDREPLERAGDRVLLVDSAGHSIAVGDVLSADLTTLAGVDEGTRRADDPDHLGAGQWASAQLARWRAAGLIAPTVLTDPTVLVIRVRVVGLENPSITADTEGMQR